tara:strand:+ start:372 stop:977 length:606 start_codon:yes stop_codon:yes gene_type:complete
MGSKPKQQDYEAGPDEKAAAAQAMFDYNRDKSIYGPITKQYTKDVATTRDPQAIASRVAGADTMQALTERPSLAAAKSVDTAANIASGAVAQQLQASQQGLATAQNLKLGALEIGKNKKAVTKLGLSDVASQERSAGLATAKKKLIENDALVRGGLQLGTSFAYAYKNKTGIFGQDSGAPDLDDGLEIGSIDYTKGGIFNS